MMRRLIIGPLLASAALLAGCGSGAARVTPAKIQGSLSQFGITTTQTMQRIDARCVQLDHAFNNSINSKYGSFWVIVSTSPSCDSTMKSYSGKRDSAGVYWDSFNRTVVATKLLDRNVWLQSFPQKNGTLGPRQIAVEAIVRSALRQVG